MQRIFNLLLIVCGLVLAIHLALTLVTERMNASRWAWTAEGRAGMKTLVNRQIDPFLYGGNPANSALVLNLRGDEDPLTTDAVDSWVYFDFEGRGQAVKTGWVGPGMGLLVIGPDVQGLVTSGRQLLGNRTLVGDPRKMTGFQALAELDDNGDGLIDQRDAGWDQLRIWLDKKPDGRVGLNELYRPEQLKITALDLNHQTENKLLRTGNILHSRGSFILANGRRGSLDEVFFQQQSGSRKYSDGLMVSPEAAALAPDLKGSGLMRAFREALTQSPELMAVYRRYQSASTRQDQLEQMPGLLDAWVEAGEAAPTMAERLGDQYNVTANCLDEMDLEELRRLKVMESWRGSHYYRLPHELYPGQELAPGVEVAEGGRDLMITCPNESWQHLSSGYDRLSTYMYERLLKATRLKPYYDRLDMNEKAGFSPVLDLLDQEFALDPDKALTDLMEFRFDLARAKAEVSQSLDDYIKARLADAYFTADQRLLYGRLPASAKPDDESPVPPAESAGATDDTEKN